MEHFQIAADHPLQQKYHQLKKTWTIIQNLQPEVKEAIKIANNGKTAGMERVTAEVWKAGSQGHHNYLEIYRDIWKKETISEEWKNELIVKLAKRGDLLNYLSSFTTKVSRKYNETQRPVKPLQYLERTAGQCISVL